MQLNYVNYIALGYDKKYEDLQRVRIDRREVDLVSEICTRQEFAIEKQQLLTS